MKVPKLHCGGNQHQACEPGGHVKSLGIGARKCARRVLEWENRCRIFLVALEAGQQVALDQVRTIFFCHEAQGHRSLEKVIRAEVASLPKGEKILILSVMVKSKAWTDRELGQIGVFKMAIVRET